jgi:DNA processing protein
MPVLLDDKLDWIALSMIPGLGNIAFRNLLNKFGNPENIFNAGISELLAVEGIKNEVALDIISKNYQSDPQEELRKVEDNGAKVITFDESTYPLPLK